MCDTIVALGNSTKDGSVLFAKNSDRDPNEAHAIVIFPAARHKPGQMVKCTYIEIPQVEETYQVLLSKPFWIWGAEMGSNEFGVTIGNEAVFTRESYNKEPGLIGMDFLRLALERSRTAETAMNTIIELLEKNGQSGNCGYAHPFYYHNSYLICDAAEAWVLETVGREWAAERVVDIRSISNGLTIGTHWDRASKGLVSHAIKKGWCKNANEFNFALCYSDPLFTYFANARMRQACTTETLRANKGSLSVKDMMSILRNHHQPKNGEYTPGRGLLGADVCMHAGWGPIRTSQTAGSMVSALKKKGTIHWLTGTAAACTSTFKPVWMDSGIPDSVLIPTANYDNKVMFWQHEVLHREILKDFANRIGVVTQARNMLEDQFLEETNSLMNALKARRSESSNQCFLKVEKVESEWLEGVRNIPVAAKNGPLYTRAWSDLNKLAGLPLSKG
ncbi:MAG: C69 family dipeptidase [Anaerolineaceae bacterium]